MIASLTGVVKALNTTSAVIDVGGIGILVHISPRLGATLLVGRMTELHTTLVVREDALTLYGFETYEDRNLFELLQTVTGIGPKVAQSAINVLGAGTIISAISSGEQALLEKVPGLGKKGAARLVLELKDKVASETVPENVGAKVWREKLHQALTGLGFSGKESLALLDDVAEERPDAASQDLETLLRIALQIRGSRS